MPLHYLRKACDAGVCHCRCTPEDALVQLPPGQLDCPWCGCGWLWSCAKCHKAFTFAERFVAAGSLAELLLANDSRASSWLRRLIGRPRAHPDLDDIEEFLADCDQSGVIARVQRDKEVLTVPEHLYRMLVYFDGRAIAADVAGFTTSGIHGAHSLDVVPQVEALSDRSIVDGLLANRAYWDHAARELAERQGA